MSMEVTKKDIVDWDRELVVQRALGTIEVSSGPRRYSVTYECDVPGTLSPLRDHLTVKALHPRHAVSIVMRRVLDAVSVSCGMVKWSKEIGWGKW